MSEANDEILQSKNKLEQIIEKKVNHFSFPFGANNDKHTNILVSAKFKTAVTTKWGSNYKETNLFKLNRITIFRTDSKETFLTKLYGKWNWIQ